ncbi:MAG: glycosyltransferase family A protein [Dehalococcoidia bacterium]|nr:glycosyltransferase family A protein [Dehalococcoidia bacterium]
MPAVSVLVCTYRCGGLDLVLGSLAKQTFTDFEIVIVDDLAMERRAQILAIARTLWGPEFAAKIIYPDHAPTRVAAASVAENKAIVNASGELCLWFCDYSWAPFDWVENHWNTYLDSNKKASAVGGSRFLNPPGVQEGLMRGAGPMGAPTGDLLHPHGDGSTPFTIFRESLEAGVAHLTPQIGGQDPKLQLHDGPTADDFCVVHFKNEGVPLRVLLALNGVEAAYDAGHRHGDSDMFHRLIESGWRFILNSKCHIDTVNVRFIMGTLPWPDSIEERQMALLRRKVVGYHRTKALRASGPDLQIEWDSLHG